MALPGPSPDATVLVTGASAGIGEALARELAARGHGLSLVARRRERLDALADELRARHGVSIRVHRADLVADAARRRLLVALERDGRQVVGLCNNAGIGSLGPFMEHDPADEVGVVRLNVLALHDLTAHLLGPMVRRGVGAILNVASILAFAPYPHSATYAATKAFAASFSEALHTELQGTGVSCTTLNPGPTRTEIWERSGAGELDGAGPDWLWQRPDDVARAAVEGMVEGKRSVIPGLTNKLAVASGRFAPRALLLPLAGRLGGQRLVDLMS